MGTDTWALIISIGAFLVGGYGAVVAHTFSAREDKRRRTELEAKPADVRAELGLLSLGRYFHAFAPGKESVAGSEASETDLAAVFRNLGGSPISIDRVEHLTITDLPIGPSEMMGDASGPVVPVVLQPNSGNSVRYSTPLSGIARIQPHVPVVDGGRIRYGFRAVLSDGSEVTSPMVTLRPPDPEPVGVVLPPD